MNHYPNEIYILDDDPVFAKALKKTLEKLMKTVVTAFHDPVTLLDNLSESRPSVVVVDFYGPLNGDKVIKKAREISKDSLIIMISCENNKENMMSCLRAGANNVILKKNILALPSLIRNHLNIRNSPRFAQWQQGLSISREYPGKGQLMPHKN